MLAASPATIDRLLASVRTTASRRKKRKRATKPSKQIPIRTIADWKDPEPGFLEIDFVSHGGTSMQGVFLWSLVATDVCSGWTEMIPLVAREQSLVVEGLTVLRRQFPMPIRGIDTDNDSAFINEVLLAYCQDQKLEFTRSRAYQKNDQAWIEQKNGAVVRRFVGYERLTGLPAGQCLARLYQMVRRYVNYFQPSFKLKSKTREGAKVRKSYHAPATPCERLLAHASISAAAKETLRAPLVVLDPLDLLHGIRKGQAALAALQSGDLSNVADRESLEEFLAKLPELWRAGEVRPTHRKEASSPRDYRTRKDPFETVWPVAVPAIVSEELFQTVQERLLDNKKRNRRTPQGIRYLLQGLIVCRDCGYAYCGQSTKRVRAARTDHYQYYFCTGTMFGRCDRERVCWNKSVRLDRLDAAVWEDVRSLLLDPRRIETEHRRRCEQSTAGAPTPASRVEQLRQTAQRRIDRILDAYEDGLLEKSEFEPRIRRARERLAQLEIEAEQERRSQASERDLQQVLGQLEMFAQCVHHRLDDADWSTRREIIRTLIRRIEIDAAEVRVVYKVNPGPFVEGPGTIRGQFQDRVRRADASLSRRLARVTACTTRNVDAGPNQNPE